METSFGKFFTTIPGIITAVASFLGIAYLTTGAICTAKNVGQNLKGSERTAMGFINWRIPHKAIEMNKAIDNGFITSNGTGSAPNIASTQPLVKYKEDTSKNNQPSTLKETSINIIDGKNQI